MYSKDAHRLTGTDLVCDKIKIVKHLTNKYLYINIHGHNRNNFISYLIEDVKNFRRLCRSGTASDCATVMSLTPTLEIVFISTLW